jgi:uncharacterized cupin superfamily protein
MKVEPGLTPLDTGPDGVESLLLSQAGGLRQFGAHLQMLPPGARSSERHWHSAEDEFLLVLEGAATVVDDDGARELGPGDAVAWRHGVPNGHHVLNLTAQPVRYLVVGSRVALDVCTYPDTGQVQINGVSDWTVVDATGKVLRGGALPQELLNLDAQWGKPHDATVTIARYLPEATRVRRDEPDLAHPILGAGLGRYRYAVLGDAGGLTQFGVHIEELPPGSASSFRHWHQTEDEMLLVLSGSPVLIEDAETGLQPGDAVCWPAGVAVGHCLINRSARPARYLVIGTRHHKDRVHYPDHDLIADKDGAARAWFHADGRVRTV